MKLTTSFETQENIEIVKTRLKSYLISENFTIISDDGENIVLKKGSRFSNFFAFNPRNWKTIVELNINEKENGTEIKSTFDINTIGQVVTEKERCFWENCVKRLENIVNSSDNVNKINSSEGKSIIIDNLKLTVWMILGAIIFGIPGSLLAHKTGISSIATIFIIGGALGAILWRIYKEKRHKDNKVKCP
jgi:hypothetical protein